MKETGETGTLEPVSDNPLRDLPRVDHAVAAREGDLPELLLVDVVRRGIEAARARLAEGESVDTDDEIDLLIHRTASARTRRVINATGVLLHTNLGRARWSKKAVDAAIIAASSTANVELSASTGERSRRGRYVSDLLVSLTGSEDALVVNNNAGALLLALATTAAGRAVPVARGELIEIGGSYRLPDVMAASGVTLVEVGATNRSRADDYETALQLSRPGAVLKVHPSNYRVEGFTEEASAAELAAVAHRAGVPFLFDIGSGLLDPETPWLERTPTWLANEPSATEAIEAGADLVLFSGDKLLGGPQAGVAIGSAEVVDKMRSHPISRALRVDGVTLAALEATLESYAAGTAGTEIPFWVQATVGGDQLKRRAKRLAAETGLEHAADHSSVGGGSVPGSKLPTWVVVADQKGQVHAQLLSMTPPIVGRIDQGSLKLDLRTVDPEDDQAVAAALRKCL